MKQEGDFDINCSQSTSLQILAKETDRTRDKRNNQQHPNSLPDA